jgi:hypothetical protein
LTPCIHKVLFDALFEFGGAAAAAAGACFHSTHNFLTLWHVLGVLRSGLIDILVSILGYLAVRKSYGYNISQVLCFTMISGMNAFWVRCVHASVDAFGQSKAGCGWVPSSSVRTR